MAILHIYGAKICLSFQKISILQQKITLQHQILLKVNNPIIVMVTSHPHNFRVNHFTEVIIPDHNAKPKLKVRAGFVRNMLLLCPKPYLYYNEVRIDDLL